MAVLFEKTKYLTDKQFHYCPGCNHGIIHRLVAEVIDELSDELNLDGKVVGVAPVGCSVFAYDYFNCDMYEAAHGRAPAVATGIKRSAKDRLVFTYQGDGDLASIGTAEIVHAAHRGEKICTIFVNNAIYGMTGGQMAPTTLIGQKATTCPAGRSEEWSGLPIKMCEMLAAVPSSYYIERVAVNNTANIAKAKKAIAKDNSADADYLRAVIAAKEGDLKTAEAQLKSAVSKNPKLAQKAANDINLKALNK